MLTEEIEKDQKNMDFKKIIKKLEILEKRIEVIELNTKKIMEDNPLYTGELRPKEETPIVPDIYRDKYKGKNVPIYESNIASNFNINKILNKSLKQFLLITEQLEKENIEINALNMSKKLNINRSTASTRLNFLSKLDLLKKDVGKTNTYVLSDEAKKIIKNMN